MNFLGKIPILKEFEWFEWFGPSPIEPFNSGRGGRPADEDPALSDRGAAQAAALAASPLVASLAGATVVSSPMLS